MRVRSCRRVAVLDGRSERHGHAHDVPGAHAGLHGLLAARAGLRPAAAQLRRLHGLRPHAPGSVAVGTRTSGKLNGPASSFGL